MTDILERYVISPPAPTDPPDSSLPRTDSPDPDALALGLALTDPDETPAARAWWRPLAVAGLVVLGLCGLAVLTPEGFLPRYSPAWWILTVVLHAPFVVILVFLAAGLVERLGYAARGRKPETPGAMPRMVPRVCIQLPMFNESTVAARAIAAAGDIVWPREYFEVQVLDDSTDPEARAAVDEAAAILRASGVRCTVLRRDDRAGYKAGALEAGRKVTGADYLAILDADFVPRPDFLMRAVPYFYDGRGRRMRDVAVVQARWAHLNRNESALTRAQSLWVDDHHVLQMSWRSAMWKFVNFTGTAGVWHADAIERAGGWRSASLVEDCELSFRALFSGHRTRFVKEITVPAELPSTYRAYRAQQKRWTQGWAQLQRLHAATLAGTYRTGILRRLHLGYHMAIPWQWPLWGAWMLLLPILVHEGLWFGARSGQAGFAVYVVPTLVWLLVAAAVATFETARIEGDRSAGVLTRGLCRVVPYAMLNTGMLPHQVAAFFEGLLGPMHSEFVRTPKTASTGGGAAQKPARARAWVWSGTQIVESLFAAYQFVWATVFAAQGMTWPAVISVGVGLCVVVVAARGALVSR